MDIVAVVARAVAEAGDMPLVEADKHQAAVVADRMDLVAVPFLLQKKLIQ